jgi:hypothetical protein
MKNDMKKYLSLGVVLAGSALMISCDGDNGDTVVIPPSETGVADAINDAIGDKPVAPVMLAEFPLTSLKLAFDNGFITEPTFGGEFEAGDELEIDFDSTTATSALDITGDAQADISLDGDWVFGVETFNGFVEGIVSDPSAPTWYINRVYAGSNAIGEAIPILGGLTFTPLASDQRSITGHFTADVILVEEVFVNQDDENVVSNGNFVYGLDDLNGSSITVYQDVDGADAEITDFGANNVWETQIGTGNVVASFTTNEGVKNFVVSYDDYNDAVGNDGEVSDNEDAQDLADLCDLLDFVNVAPTGNQIEADSETLHLVAGVEYDSVVGGSYRHDYDSTFGTPETIINSSNGEFFEGEGEVE